MTSQDVYNEVAKHLLTQRAKSVEPDATRNSPAGSYYASACRYRGAHGLKCAIGPFIPDDRYSDKLEHKTVSQPLVVAALRDDVRDWLHAADVNGDPKSEARIEALNERLDLVRRLQNVHDMCEVSSWADNLREIAEDCDLTPFTLEML